jgi:hypothetical protein
MKRNNKKKAEPRSPSAPVPAEPEMPAAGFDFTPKGKVPADLCVPFADLEESLIDCMRYPIPKMAVESCDVTQLVHDLRPSLTNPFFAAGPGKMIFEVEGYDIDPRHLALVPEFRGFLQKAEEFGLSWFYFAWPHSEWPNLVMLACSTKLSIRNLDHETLQFGMDRDELGEFLRSQVARMEFHCAATGISEAALVNQLEQVFVRWFPDYLVDDEPDSTDAASTKIESHRKGGAQ